MQFQAFDTVFSLILWTMDYVMDTIELGTVFKDTWEQKEWKIAGGRKKET